jgi:small subunit ribosomal protein S35
MACAARALSRSTLLLSRRCPARSPRVLQRPPPLVQQFRFFSASPFVCEKNNSPSSKNTVTERASPIPEFSVNDLPDEDKEVWNMMSPEERSEFEAEYKKYVEEYNDPARRREESAELDRIISQIEREAPEPPEMEKKPVLGFWGEDEEDEFAIVEDGNESSDDVITSMAEAELELHREMRHYARIAAWDMPLLARAYCSAATCFVPFFPLQFSFISIFSCAVAI